MPALGRDGCTQGLLIGRRRPCANQSIRYQAAATRICMRYTRPQTSSVIDLATVKARTRCPASCGGDGDMIDFTEILDGETWELFGRDFLQAQGFFIETHPDRGADRGRDFLVTEQLTGRLGQYRLRWLVSCKHLAASGTAVSESHEPNIVERLESFQADGFIGFYSTLSTNNLNTRLQDLRQHTRVKDYRLFDGRAIEGVLVRAGYSELLLRYLPRAYRALKPLHIFGRQYMPLPCAACERDLLEDLYASPEGSVVVYLRDSSDVVVDMWWSHKGECDHRLADDAHRRGLHDTWNDIGDLATPLLYLKHVMALLNQLRAGTLRHTDSAFDKQRRMLIALGQRVFREATDQEVERLQHVMELEELFHGSS
jgi:hypothetical protein